MELTLTIPECRWRTPQNFRPDILYTCNSPKIVTHGPIPLTVCADCYLANHEAPPPPVQRIRPRTRCRHFGPQIGMRDCATCQGKTRLKVFSCSHPSHPDTTYNCWINCPDQSDPVAGVVLGCYGWPKLIRLQIRIIRELCGVGTPILVCDDCSPAAAEIEKVCSEEMVYFSCNPVRLGHYAGDLSVFRKGIEWGKEKNLDIVTKLSQRLIMLRYDWLYEVTNELWKSQAETYATPIIEGAEQHLRWRSELLGMRVSKWVPTLDMIQADRLNNCTEFAINHLLVKTFAGRVAQSDLLLPNRYARSPGSLWHCANYVAEYRSLAAKHGLEMDEDFSTAGRDKIPGWKVG